MSIDGADSFRVLSYRRAAEAVEQTTVDLMAVVADTERLLEIPVSAKAWPPTFNPSLPRVPCLSATSW